MIYNPDAFYRKDTETMFREAVSASVFEAVDELLVANNRPPLTLEERQAHDERSARLMSEEPLFPCGATPERLRDLGEAGPRLAYVSLRGRP